MSLASNTLYPVDPEEPTEPFEPFKESSNGPADAVSICSSTNNSADSVIKGVGSQLYNSSSLTCSPATTSTFLSSLSPPHRGETSRGDVGATGNLSDSAGPSGDLKLNGTPYRDVSSAGSSVCIKGSPHFLGGFRRGMGGTGSGGRPSPASRLTLVDKKWLERCQVFGEMGAEERPGAGNQETDVEKRKEKERARETEGEKIGKGKIDENGDRREAVDLGQDKNFKDLIVDKIGNNGSSSQQPANKSKEHKDKVKKKKKAEEIEKGPPPTTEDGGKPSPKSRVTKKRARKRQRDDEGMEGETTEEGAVKKKRRNGKKKEETSDVTSPAQGGGKKRKTKKKEDDDDEEEENKETKEPKKVRNSNYVHLIHNRHFCSVFYFCANALS